MGHTRYAREHFKEDTFAEAGLAAVSISEPDSSACSIFLTNTALKVLILITDFRHPMYVSEVVMVVATCPICRTGALWGLLVTIG